MKGVNICFLFVLVFFLTQRCSLQQSSWTLPVPLHGFNLRVRQTTPQGSRLFLTVLNHYLFFCCFHVCMWIKSFHLKFVPIFIHSSTFTQLQHLMHFKAQGIDHEHSFSLIKCLFLLLFKMFSCCSFVKWPVTLQYTNTI